VRDLIGSKRYDDGASSSHLPSFIAWTKLRKEGRMLLINNINIILVLYQDGVDIFCATVSWRANATRNQQ